MREIAESEGRYEANEEYGWVRSAAEVSVMSRGIGWLLTAVLPLATREGEADRRDSCLSADEADGHKAICDSQVSDCMKSGHWLPSYLDAARGHDCA